VAAKRVDITEDLDGLDAIAAFEQTCALHIGQLSTDV